MNLKPNTNMNKITYHKYPLIFFTFIFIYSHGIFAQNFDEDFINSLPDNIKDDVLVNIQNSSAELQATKDYSAFNSRIIKKIPLILIQAFLNLEINFLLILLLLLCL